MTATLANGSALQTITEAATLSAFSVFIKRITGTGTVTLQQGASTLEISASINTSTYTRVELDATVLNPAIGIVLGTNGDKIAVDMVQFENGGFASTPIPTTTVAVTRNADVLTFVGAGNIGIVGAWLADYTPMYSGVGTAGSNPAILGTSSANEIDGYFASDAQTLSMYGGQAGATQAFTRTAGTTYKMGGSWSSVETRAAVNGVVSAAGAASIVASVPAVMQIGGGPAVTPAYAAIRNFRIYPTVLSTAQLQAMTT